MSVDQEELYRTHEYLVQATLTRLYPNPPAGIERDDLLQAGRLGLWKAVARYDPSRPIRFRHLAITWIKGSIREELRAEDWIPRSVRAKVRAGELGPASVIQVISLDQPLGSGDDPPSGSAGGTRSLLSQQHDRTVDAEAEAMARLQAEILWRAVSWLPQREALTITRLYRDQKQIEVIAREWNLSVSRLYQFARRGLNRLKGFLGPALYPGEVVLSRRRLGD